VLDETKATRRDSERAMVFHPWSRNMMVTSRLYMSGAGIYRCTMKTRPAANLQLIFADDLNQSRSSRLRCYSLRDLRTIWGPADSLQTGIYLLIQTKTLEDHRLESSTATCIESFRSKLEWAFIAYSRSHLCHRAVGHGSHQRRT
jgi:hypothetical protein